MCSNAPVQANVFGNWTCQVAGTLSVGDTISAVANETGKADSPATQTMVSSGATSAPSTPNVAASNGSVVNGQAEPNMQISVMDPGSGAVLCTTTSNAQGGFSCSPVSPAPDNGDVLNVIATRPGSGSSSLPARVTVDQRAPTAPTIDPVTTITDPVTGTAEPGVSVHVTGLVCDNAPIISDAAGHWSCETTSALPIIAPTTVTVVTTDPAGNTSVAVITVVVDPSVTSSPPQINPVNDTATAIMGTAMPGASIDLSASSPSISCSNSPVEVDVFGDWSCQVTGTLSAGDTISAIASEDGKADSPVAQTDISDSTVTAPSIPSVDPTDGSVVTGEADPNTQVSIIDPDTGTVLCTTTSDTQGDYLCSPISPAQGDGEVLNVISIDLTSGSSSVPGVIAVDQTPPSAPIVDPVFDPSTPVTGTGEPGSTITITGPLGTTLCTTTVNIAGLFSCVLTPEQVPGISFDVVSEDATGNASPLTNAFLGLPPGTLADADADGDGIPNGVECLVLFPNGCANTDGDQVNASQPNNTGGLNLFDTDSDNDGILDAVEAGPDATRPIDTDGDGMPDYVDTDSDNDGILDSAEGLDDNNDGKLNDSDGDGIPDYVDSNTRDNDGDNIPDAMECPFYPICLDSDNDGQPDYTEQDSDADGLPDIVEALSMNDSDSDGIADIFDVTQTGGADVDGNGIDDAARAIDVDGDGSPNYRDVNSDNQGASDTLESIASGLDSDGDGIDDVFDVDVTGGIDINGDGIDDAMLQVALNDADGDGIPDYVDGDAQGVLGVNGSGDSDSDGIPDQVECPDGYPNCPDTDGDGMPDYMDTDEREIITGLSGSGSISLFIAMCLLSLLLIQQRYMVMALMLLAFSASAQADEGGSWYIGAGAGASYLDPDTNTTGYRVAEDSDDAYKFFLGYDFGSHFTVELSYADLGEAGLDSINLLPLKGSVQYDLPGISLLYYMNTKTERGLRQGLMPFVKAGAAAMKTSSDITSVKVNQDYDAQLFMGLGLEYGFDNDWAIRIDTDFFDEDAAMGSVSLLRRFGQ
jgi:hypothetical protein